MKFNLKWISAVLIILVITACKQGEVGPQGPVGDKGETGKAGISSTTIGPVGDQGAKGGQGPTGDKGLPGIDGLNGTGNLVSSVWSSKIEWLYQKKTASNTYIYEGHIPFREIDKTLINTGILNLQLRLINSTESPASLKPGITWTLSRTNEKIIITENGFYEGYFVIKGESVVKYTNDSDLLTRFPIEGKVIGLKGN